MADFAMCGLCGREYADPACRRFHAQPIACPRCGPAVWLVDPQGRQIAADDAVARAARMLQESRIVAIKGLGGFHLACRADDEHVVRRLRRRKRRDAKPFAIMVGDIGQAERLCEVSREARRLLTGPLRPIVLLPRRPAAQVARAVADGLDTLGVMLPYTPLHHLLFSHGLGPQVMTSGNYSEEPLVKDNEAAIGHLGQLADALLLHNRRIERRLDDSVVQARGDNATLVLRRARGYAPQPVEVMGMPQSSAAVLAVGAELKSAVCLLRGRRAVLSEHIGDLKDGRVYRHFIGTIHHLEELFGFEPEIIAADLHPTYLSTEYALRRHRGDPHGARGLAGRRALPLIRVQHHHAHIASCMAEHGRSDSVIGLACDGVGYGDDGAVWGCEVLKADLVGYERLGHLRYLPMIGGDAASVETYRPALAALHDAFGDDLWRVVPSACLRGPAEDMRAAAEMLTVGLNCPPASSLGRWFDAVAHLAGVAEVNRYEAEAPMRLEAAAASGVEDAYSFRLQAGGPFVIDLRPMVEGLVADVCCNVPADVVAAKFHNSVVRFLAAAARRAREETAIGTVALSGGCFANRYVTVRLIHELKASGFKVLTHHRVPCNDGAVALGQAVVAAARKAVSASADVHEGRSR
jgi:hydrogenase maturation protein HypF